MTLPSLETSDAVFYASAKYFARTLCVTTNATRHSKQDATAPPYTVDKMPLRCDHYGIIAAP